MINNEEIIIQALEDVQTYFYSEMEDFSRAGGSDHIWLKWQVIQQFVILALAQERVTPESWSMYRPEDEDLRTPHLEVIKGGRRDE